jgi:hypothetical protein
MVLKKEPYLCSEEINFHRYIEGFFVCLQNYSEESIRHKNREIFKQNQTVAELTWLSTSLLWSIFAWCSTLFSKPPTYIYTVKTTESDHKKTYQEYLKEKTFRTVTVIYFAIKNKYVFIKFAVGIYVAMCC